MMTAAAIILVIWLAGALISYLRLPPDLQEGPEEFPHLSLFMCLTEWPKLELGEFLLHAEWWPEEWWPKKNFGGRAE